MPGVWMRTHGCSLLGLPDLALLAAGHAQGERVFDLFASVLNHLLVTKEALTAGDTLQLGNDWYLRARLPTARDRPHPLDDRRSHPPYPSRERRG